MSSILEQSKIVTADSPTDWKIVLAGAMRGDESSRDLEIVCGDHSFQIHRVIAALHSKFFRDNTQSKVVAEDTSPAAVKLMIEYFYTATYPDPMSVFTDPGAGDPRNSLEGHSQVFTLAHKYDVPGLYDMAESKFENATLCVWDDNATEAALRKLAEDLTVAMPHISRNKPTQDYRLCELALRPWEAKGNRLLRRVHRTDLRDLFLEVPEFAMVLLESATAVKIGRLAGEKKRGGEVTMAKDGKGVDIGSEEESTQSSQVAGSSSKSGGWFGWWSSS